MYSLSYLEEILHYLPVNLEIGLDFVASCLTQAEELVAEAVNSVEVVAH